MIQNTSFEASDFFSGGGGGACPRTPLEHTRLAVVFINSWKNRRRPPPPFVNSWIRNWGSYTVLNIAFCAWLSNMWPVYLHSMLKSYSGKNSIAPIHVASMIFKMWILGWVVKHGPIKSTLETLWLILRCDNCCPVCIICVMWTVESPCFVTH